VKFLCEQCKAKYQIADEKAVGKTVRMKCRKCGHLIEVRAAVTETSVSSAAPAVSSSPPGERPSANLAVQGPIPTSAPPRATTGAAAVRVAPRADRSTGALEGAFKTAVQHDNALAAPPRRIQHTEEEHSTPFDMSDLSPSDEWYVAINGVPVGPIRVAEVRRKAALGAVTEDSLVWQEGLDEWRPLRSFPELATSVREAMSRLSRPPPAEARSSTPPPPPSRAARMSVAPSPRLAPPRSLPAPSSAVAARSNVVPIMSRLATAERLDPAPPQRSSPLPGPPPSSPPTSMPSVAPDPFANAPAMAVAAPLVPSFIAPAPASVAPPPPKKSPPWILYAMFAAAIAFGMTAGVSIVPVLLHPAPAATAAVAAPPPGPAALAAPPVATAAPPAATNDIAEPVVTAAPVAGRPSTPKSAASPTAVATTQGGRSLDLHALTQSAPNIAPTEEPGADTPKATGGQLTESQVQQVLALHRTAIGRICWERNPTNKSAVNVNVGLTVAGDGSAQNVVATGDDASVAKCIENDVRGWHFPATGSSQKIAIPFKFVRQ
jgi:predicted Zn finger-like uncharacterized protein